MKNISKMSKSSLFSSLILAVMIICTLYIIFNGLGRIEGLNFGGSYYYTDIPNWEKIFFGENSITVKVNPVLFFTLFTIWGITIFKFMLWIERKK